jgi:hypothetical protein
MSAGAAAGSRRNKKRAAAARQMAKRNSRREVIESGPVFSWVSVAQAADILHLSQSTVRKRVNSGEFISRKANGRTEVSVQTA